MPQTVNQRRKEILESCDHHLFVAIDRAWTLWTDICRQHPELGHELIHLMVEIERSRFVVEQFYHLCWGGRPGWLMQMTEITHRMRQQRAEWAREIAAWQEYGGDLVDSAQK